MHHLLWPLTSDWAQITVCLGLRHLSVPAGGPTPCWSGLGPQTTDAPPGSTSARIKGQHYWTWVRTAARQQGAAGLMRGMWDGTKEQDQCVLSPEQVFKDLWGLRTCFRNRSLWICGVSGLVSGTDLYGPVGSQGLVQEQVLDPLSLNSVS